MRKYSWTTFPLTEPCGQSTRRTPPTSFFRQSFKVHLHPVCWWGQGRWGTSPTKRTRLISTDTLCKPVPCALDRQKQTRNSFSGSGSQGITRASFWNWKPGSSSSLGFAVMQDNRLSSGIEEEEGAQSAFVLSSLWVSYSVPIFISIVITVNYFSIPISSYKRIIFSDALSLWRANQMLSLRGVSCSGLWRRTTTYLNRCSPPEM